MGQVIEPPVHTIRPHKLPTIQTLPLLLLLVKSITCTLVQTGHFLAATGYVAPTTTTDAKPW